MLEEIKKDYDMTKHYNIPCVISEGDNPTLSKMLTGEGAKVAMEKFPEHIAFEAELEQEDKFKIYKIAKALNDNPDVELFTCVTNTGMSSLFVKVWGSQELMTAANLLGENGTVLLNFLINGNH